VKSKRPGAFLILIRKMGAVFIFSGRYGPNSANGDIDYIEIKPQNQIFLIAAINFLIYS